ncbi:MAG: hypothetical protein Q8930_19525, partial [Bacillota bacterium]|nr:hypothetical protein [Bacillota bacterium]
MSKGQIPFFRRLRIKVSLAVLAILLVVTAALSGTLYYVSSTTITRNTAEKAFNIAEAAAK